MRDDAAPTFSLPATTSLLIHSVQATERTLVGVEPVAQKPVAEQIVGEVKAGHPDQGSLRAALPISQREGPLGEQTGSASYSAGSTVVLRLPVCRQCPRPSGAKTIARRN